MKRINELLQPSVQLAKKLLSKLQSLEPKKIVLIVCIVTLALVALSCAGCTQSSPQSAVIPPLSSEARQPPVVEQCSPTCLESYRTWQANTRLRLIDLE